MGTRRVSMLLLGGVLVFSCTRQSRPFATGETDAATSSSTEDSDAGLSGRDAEAADGGSDANSDDASSASPTQSSGTEEAGAQDAAVDAIADSADAESTLPEGGGFIDTGTSSERCGDGVLDEEEGCDDGNHRGEDGCDVRCEQEPGWECVAGEDCEPVCGDGDRVGPEATAGGCDEGDVIGGDGCSSQCQVEPGWSCPGMGVPCSANCGNGHVDANEVCDDGNQNSDDGCTACQLEAGFTCDSVVLDTPQCRPDGNLYAVNLCGEAVELDTACPGDCVQDACRCVIRVTPGGNDGNTGSTWASALRSIQAGLDAAAPNGCEVWVREGTYTPGYYREDTIQLRSGVALYGGFVGTEAVRAERDWQANPTVLSGQVKTYPADDPSDDAFHVVTGADNALLDGFTVSFGNTDGAADWDCGGGLVNVGVSPTVRNTIFSDHRGSYSVCNQDAAPVFEDCAFLPINATGYFQSRGMYIERGSAVLTNCTFDNVWGGILNVAARLTIEGGGFLGNWTFGAIQNQEGELLVRNATFTRNHNDDEYFGGSCIETWGGAVTVVDSTFDTNNAEGAGTIYAQGGTHYIANSRFYNNSYDYGPCGSAVTGITASITIAGSVFADNQDAVCLMGGGGSFVNNTFVNNGGTVEGGALRILGALVNVDNSIFVGNSGNATDELYADTNAVVQLGRNAFSSAQACSSGLDCEVVDVGLQSIGGEWVPSNASAIDTGDNDVLPTDLADMDGDGDLDETLPFDLVGNPRLIGTSVDLGAIEVQP